MSHLAIYRKYRPTNFNEVSGQKVVVNVLKNAITTNNMSHAYLFTGPRGTGKTSIAKILARTINCENLKDGNPCNECPSCINSASKECVDIIEIDAASNNGVDEIRELKSKINIVPSFLKYKVYIIDEVHMLSIGAFNALLKTLEEPPSHVIFVLATTEIQKVPATILSRCQVLEFKKISNVDMHNRIEYICNNENISISFDAIDEIIRCSDGCMRDALSLLEKINSYCAEKIEVNDVRLICGKPEKDKIKELIDNLINCNLDSSIELANSFYYQDYDMLYIIEDIIDELDEMIFVDHKSDNNYKKMLEEFIKTYDLMKKSSVSKKIIFEIGIINYIDAVNQENISREIFLNKRSNCETANNCNKSRDENKNLSVIEKPVILESNFELDKFKNIRLNNVFVNANKDFLKNIKNKWLELKGYAFDKTNGAKICSLLDGTPVVANESYVILSYQYAAMADRINSEYNELEKILSETLNIDYNIVAVADEEWNSLKKVYIQKIGNGEEYKLVDDAFVCSGKLEHAEQIPTKVKTSDSADDKVFELFDNDLIEIK